MSSRSIIGTELVSMFNATGIFNSVKYVSNIDNKYPYDLLTTELPAIKMHSTDESYDYEQSSHAMLKLGMDVWVYSLAWDMDSVIVEAPVLKAVRDVLGANPRLNGKAVNASIKHIVKTEMDYPLVLYKVNVDIMYESMIENV